MPGIEIDSIDLEQGTQYATDGQDRIARQLFWTSEISLHRRKCQQHYYGRFHLCPPERGKDAHRHGQADTTINGETVERCEDEKG